MNIRINSLARLAPLCGTLAALLGTALVPNVGIRPALAHQAPCPYCNMTVADANAAVLSAGRKRIEYKCVYCALAEAKTEYSSGNISISAPTEKAGHPVTLRRTANRWSAAPASAYFVAPAHIKHRICQAQARAFTTKAAASAFARSSGGMVMTLDGLNAQAK